MSKVFVISDTWFNRPMEDDPNVNIVDHNDHLISCWNEVVEKEDKIYVLGGFGIADLYHIVSRLNGEIHFLDNYFNENEKMFIDDLKKSIEMSADEEIRSRVVFENKQVMGLPELDCFISYFPITEWPGKPTGTFCFHGVDESINIYEHNISAMASKWESLPIDVDSIEESVKTFENEI